MHQLVQKLIIQNKTSNPIEIAENLGITIIYESLGSVNGYYNKTLKHKFIHVNCALRDREELFTEAHELGHALIHPNSNTPFLRKNTYLSIDKMEIEANEFAVNLLISDDEIKECMEQEYTIFQTAQYFGYNYKLIELRLKDFSI